MEITLDMLLDSRDRRQARQKALMSAHPSQTLVCLTVIMPGALKRNLHSLIVANAAMTAVLECFNTTLVHIEAYDLPTGYEAYLVVDLDPIKAKEMACAVEDTHPLGRLFDLDIMQPDATPMSRAAVNYRPRQCLLCPNEARWCMRNRTHTVKQLQSHISEMIEAYVR